jgi:hypothetical protein
MKAEQRKEIETNSLVLAVQRLRKHTTGRTLYYVLGTLALVVGVILVWNYFSGQSKKARDAVLIQLASADTPEKLKQGMEDHRGTIYGSLFKLHLARHLLLNEGLPKLGTDSPTTRTQAANAVGDARKYFLELTTELKEKEEPALVQEAWLGAAQAEEALVGLPGADGTTDSRGNVDKVVEYYERASAIFPDTEFSKRYKARAEKLKANKDRFVKDQETIYKEREFNPFSGPPVGPGKTNPLDFGGPPIPGLPKTDLPGGPTPPPPPAPTPDAAKKTPDPKPADPPKGPDPKAK